MDREFEEMMNELSRRLAEDSENEFENDLIEDIKPTCIMVEALYRELLSRGFTDEQSFEFATELTMRMLEANL